ncbi:MAG: ATP-binding protein [Alphaproteobacteria bacterium]|nr:ATP-binding protein [Alphaproteobacteria bacterium]
MDNSDDIQVLKECAHKYRAIFDNTSIGIFNITKNGKWLEANEAIANILGYGSAEQLLDNPPDILNQFFVDEKQKNSWFAGVLNNKKKTEECAVYTADNSIVWISLSGQIILNSVGEEEISCVVFDITGHKDIEKTALYAKEQAEIAVRSESEFLANMSHELRTPLNAIIGFSEIIKNQIFGPAGQPQYVEYAQDIYDSGQLLLSLINDILDMSKVEARKRQLYEVPLNIEHIAQSVVRLVAARAKEGKVKLSIHVPKGFPALRGEEKAMKQILINLLTNAIKFTHEGGGVTLSALIDEQKRLLINVIDNGIGIASEDIGVALTPFGQIENALSRKHQGTGLGLPLAKALVELHEGVMEIKSEVGVGTTVSIIFPASRVIEAESV